MTKMSALSRRKLFSPPSSDGHDTLVHITSLLVHATDAGCLAVRRALEGIAGAEVLSTPHARKLAIVLESPDDRSIAAIAGDIQNLAGVINVSIVAHVVEPEHALRGAHEDG